MDVTLSDAAGVTIEEKNWPPVFPIIHHDISKEIPIHAQKLQYLAFASWLGMFAYVLYNTSLGWKYIVIKPRWGIDPASGWVTGSLVEPMHHPV